MPLGTAHNTVTTAANYIPEWWLHEVIAAFKANNVMRGLVTLYPHEKKKGDTLHIPNFTRSLASDKVASTAVTFVAPTHGENQILINKHKHYATLMEDIVDIQAMSDLLRQAYNDDAGNALGRDVDFQLHVLGTGLQGGTLDATPGTPDANTLLYGTAAKIGGDGQTGWNPASAGNGTALSDAGVRRSMRRLDDVNVPLSTRYWVVPPVTRESLLGIPRFTEQAFQGSGDPIKTGMIGKLYGDEVYVSTECGTTTNTGGSVSFRALLYVHKSAFGLAEQLKPRAQTQYDAEFLGTMFIVDTIYGTAELRDNAGVALIVPS